MQSKSIFASVTFWGAVVAMLAPLLKHFGVQLSADDQASIIGQLATLAGMVAQIVGPIVAIWGRLRASKATHLVTPKVAPPLAGAALILLCLLPLTLAVTACSGKKPVTAHHAAAAGAGGLASALSTGQQLNEQLFSQAVISREETIAAAKGVDQITSANDIFIARLKSMPVVDQSNLPQVLSWFGDLSGSVRQANDEGLFHVKNAQGQQQIDAWSTAVQGALNAISGFLANAQLGQSGAQLAEGVTAAAQKGK